MEVRDYFSQIIDLFYPRSCFYLGKRLGVPSFFRYISDEARRGFIECQGPACPLCGLPYAGEVTNAKTCPKCLDLNPVFDGGRAAFMHKGPAQKLVHELKYHAGFHLWKDVAKLLQSLKEYSAFFDEAVLVPVPLHASKLRQRGFNQSYFLAKKIGKIAWNTRVEEILVRTKATDSQTYLSKKERIKNVKNAFSLSRKSVIKDQLKYILIDDVFTTGATLNECANVLKQHGVKRIYVGTLAHA